MKSILRNNRGNTLMQVVIAGGIGLTLALALTTMLNNIQKQSTIMNMKIEVMNTTRLSETAFGNTASCMANLRNNNVVILGAPSSFAGNQVNFSAKPLGIYQLATDTTPKLAITPLPVSSQISIPNNGISLANVTQISANNYVADLQMNVTHNVDGVAQLRPIILKSIKIETDALGAPTNCSYGQTGQFQAVTCRVINGATAPSVYSSSFAFTGVASDVCTGFNSGGYWGMNCNVPDWQYAGCSFKGVKIFNGTVGTDVGASGCSMRTTAIDGATGATTIYLTCIKTN